MSDAIIISRDDLEAVEVELASVGVAFTAEYIWDVLMAHRTMAGFTDPAWRRRYLDVEPMVQS